MTDNSRVRVSMVGVVVVALFAALLARLWFLQMGPEQHLRAEAIVRATRVVQTEAPRGRILDRNGLVLAQDRPAWAVTVARDLEPATRVRVIGQLAEVLGRPVEQLEAAYDSPRQSPLKPAIVALDVARDKYLPILERHDDYPGVDVTQLTVRTYPTSEQFGDPTFAAPLLGYVGEIDKDQLRRLRASGYQPGDSIGRDGVEAAFEPQLRGDPERIKVEIDPTGKQVGAPIEVRPAAVGKDVVLTIDAHVQRAAEEALRQGMDAARTLQNTAIEDHFERFAAPAGAVVVLDVHDGSVLAMASNPSYPLDWWRGGISEDRYALLTDPGAHNPLLNRATQGVYLPGSTFKLVPAIALNQYNVLGASQYLYDRGSISFGGTTFHNDNGAVNGSVNLARALTVSSDVYFYSAGLSFWQIWDAGDHERGIGIQRVAADLGFEQPTGVELDEASGRIPDPAWKAAFAKANYTGRERDEHAIWYPADNIFAAIGQGDDAVTPLQLANAYATFANGGTRWTPHVGLRVEDPATKHVLSRSTPRARSSIAIDPYVRSQIIGGLRGAVADPTGTAYGAFRGLSVAVAGKTGTAQVKGKGSTSLFAGFFPADDPDYVVLAVVEEGGYGGRIAAPVVRQVIEAMNGLPLTPIVPATAND